MTPSAFKALNKLKKIREKELDDVRAVVAECLAAEKSFEDKITEIEGEITNNIAVMAEEKNKNNQILSDSYRSWLPLAKQQIEDSKENLKLAQARTEEIRIHLREALKNLKGIEILIEGEEKRREIERQKAEQNDIDERAQILKARELMEED